MKIALTGGGSGGHFYPLIAVAEEIRHLAKEHNIVPPEILYFSNTEFDKDALYKHNITYKHVTAGKLRTYVSVQNGVDMIKTLVGFPEALKLMYRVWPDVVFSKGGYVSVPVVLAARVLRIPVFIHDSDSIPGRANLWAASFAKKIAISYPEAATYFEKYKEKVDCVGNPIRNTIKQPIVEGAHEAFSLSPDTPTVLVLGGSQGAEAINAVILNTLDEILPKYQVIHQVGKEKFKLHKEMAALNLEHNDFAKRYKPVPYFDEHTLRQAVGAADIIVSRAGSGAIFEIAAWAKPAILIPIPQTVSRDQRKNAYTYARAGGAVVIEQANFTPHVFLEEIDRILTDTALREEMVAAAKAFARPDAARHIAEELLNIAIQHEKDRE